MNKTDFGRLSVLVLDDNRHFVTLLSDMLRLLGVRTIFECVDVAGAAEIMNEQMLDIATVDVRMPEMSGFEFVKSVRNAQNGKNRMVPIIMVSAFGSGAALAYAIGCGAEEFMIKPITPASLYDRISFLMQHHHTYIQAPNYFGPERRRELVNRNEKFERRKIDLAEIIPHPPQRLAFI